MAARSEPLFAGMGYDQESGGTASIVSSGGRTVQAPPKVETKQRTFKPFSQMTLMEQVTAFVAVTSIVLALIAMIVEGSYVVIATGILQMIIGTFAYYQQTRITLMSVLKEKTHVLEKETARLEEDNTRMTYYLDELEGRMEDLLDVEDALEVIENSERQSVDALEKDAVVNREIAAQLRHTVKVRTIEALMCFLCSRQGVLNDDATANPIITEEETAILISRLDKITGLTFLEDRLKKAIVGNTNESIVDALQNLLDEETPTKSQIFR